MPEDLVGDGQDERMEEHVVEGAGLGRDAVDAPGLEALERVAPGRQRLEVGLEPGPDAGDLVAVDRVLDDCVPVTVEGGEYPLDRGHRYNPHRPIMTFVVTKLPR